jgi:hypothetical protein
VVAFTHTVQFVFFLPELWGEVLHDCVSYLPITMAPDRNNLREEGLLLGPGSEGSVHGARFCVSRPVVRQCVEAAGVCGGGCSPHGGQEAENKEWTRNQAQPH